MLKDLKQLEIWYLNNIWLEMTRKLLSEMTWDLKSHQIHETKQGEDKQEKTTT
jgi:hypothetical protein